MSVAVRGHQTVDNMPINELERRASHALALLAQAEDLMPGVVGPDVSLARLDDPRAGAAGIDWMERRAVLQRLARRTAQLGARLTDAAWRMEQQAHEDLLVAGGPGGSGSERYGLLAAGS